MRGSHQSSLWSSFWLYSGEKVNQSILGDRYEKGRHISPWLEFWNQQLWINLHQQHQRGSNSTYMSSRSNSKSTKRRVSCENLFHYRITRMYWIGFDRYEAHWYPRSSRRIGHSSKEYRREFHSIPRCSLRQPSLIQRHFCSTKAQRVDNLFSIEHYASLVEYAGYKICQSLQDGSLGRC
jgi:hypothetical protein